jgi:glycosyltransferase involved in cell wall biosynthesis
MAGRGFALSRSDEELITIRVKHRESHIPFRTGVTVARGLLSALRRLECSGFRPDLIHAHVYEVGIAALVAGRRYRVPVVVSEHSSHFSLGTLPTVARWRAQFVFRAADLVCPVSNDLRTHMERQGIHGRFQVVPNPVDTDIFAPTPPPPEPPRVVFVGGLDPIKRVDLLLRALAIVRRSDVCLDIIGDGPSRCDLEGLTRRLGLSRSVRFHGYLPRSEVAMRLRSAHFLVLTSVVETFGVVLAEALVAGRPVVAGRVGAIGEIVDERSGILVPPGDEHALAEAIDQMIRRRGEFDWRTLSSGAVSRFGLDAIGTRWDAAYRSLLRAD